MSKIDLISDNWSNLVFDGRNKAYGAYAIRQETGKRNVWSMLAILLMGVLVYGILSVKNYVDDMNAKRLANQANELSLIEMENEKKEEPKVERQEIPEQKQQEVIQEVKSSTAFQVPEIKKDDQVTNQVTSQDDVFEKKEAIGSFNVEGNNEDAGKLEAKQVVVNEPVKPKEEEVTNKVFDVVEVMPSFPGGQGALMDYLRNNVKYPVVAQENGVQGRVVVSFVVEKDGSITDVKVVKSVDPSLDKEASRVVRSMPKWIPGKQNGSAVRVKYNVPVSFKLQ